MSLATSFHRGTAQGHIGGHQLKPGQHYQYVAARQKHQSYRFRISDRTNP
jgi:hypothetical protein